MTRITKLSALVSMSLVAVFSVHLLSGKSSTETVDTRGDKISAIEARMVNEKLYNQPYETETAIVLESASLEGSELSVSFQLDEDHNLLADSAVKDMFEYFLSTLGEYELEQVIGSIQSTIHSELSEPARSQALDLLKRYIDYKIGIDELQKGFGELSTSEDIIGTLIAQQAEIKAYRERYFDQQEYDAFFYREDVQNSFLIEQLRINGDESLSIEEKQQRLEIAAMELPEDIRETRSRAQRHALLGEQVKILKQQNASASEVYQMREQALGSEAAKALADLDVQRESWNQRLKAFSIERDSVIESSLSDSDKQTSITELLAYHFNDQEQKRVSALMLDGRL